MPAAVKAHQATGNRSGGFGVLWPLSNVLSRLRPIDDCAARSIFVVRHGQVSAATASKPSSSPYAASTLAQRTLTSLREHGPRTTAAKIRGALGRQRVVIYELQRERVFNRAASVRGVAIKQLAEADIPAYIGMGLEAPYSEQVIAGRFRAGDSCFVAWLEERIVGARWVSTARADIGPLEISFPILPGIAYAYGAFTVPEERGRGIGALVTAELFYRASTAGAKRIINGVLPSNRSGQLLARGRSKPLGLVRAVDVGPWLIVNCRIPPGYLGAPLPIDARRPSRVNSSTPIVGS
jgi:GNAT superfamily N-acetyltransferase